MKRITAIALVLIMVQVFSLLPVTPAQAEGKSYDFMVGGVSVTGDNAADILGDGLFSYDAETNTLTVKGSKDFSVNAVVNNNPSLTIFVANDATLTSSGCTTLLSFCDFTVTGPGKLTLKPVNSTKADAVFLHAGTMTLVDADVCAFGKRYGITGNNKGELVVRNSWLKASGDGGGIACLADFTVEGCRLTTPYNGRIVSSGVLAPEDAYETYAVQAHIDPIRYDLWIAGTQAAETNREDILGDGAFSYDPDTKTLTVRGDLNRTGSLIVNNIDGLTIYVAKDAVLDTDDAAITTGKDLRITGPGKLGLLANFGVKAIYDATVTLQNANVSAVGYYPITGGLSGTNKLIIQNSDVVSTGITAAVSGFKGGIELIDCTLIKPEDGKVGERAIENADGSVATQVTIRKKAEYDLQIGGVKVDEGNASDILADGGFSYDAAENTLTVRGNYTGTGQGIVNSIPNLTVYAEKDAKLSAGGAALMTRENLTITGPGKLTLESSTDCGIYAVNGAAVTIEKSTLDASGEWGIAGNHTGEKLEIEGSTVYANGSSGAICDFDGGIDLIGCEIFEPAGGKVKDGAIVDGSGVLPYEAIIKVEGASGLPCSGGEDCPGKVFTDMPAKGNWAHDAIDWAIVYKVTAGTSATTFSPKAGCTRAQVVTFLWQAAGEPEPTGTSNPFTDVKEGAYYYKAVLWASETGVTAGTSATTFSPGATCTRAQIVTFLWRFEGEPASSTTTNPFTDVKAGAYYEKAVLWASETGVTAGTSATTFSPDDTCTRAQVVTFLYKDIESSDQ